MGPSGTGKTTLLRLIGGQLKPEKGEIILNGDNIAHFNRKELFEMRKKMGMLFQSGALFSDLSVFENVAFPLRVHTQLSEDMIRDLVLLKLQAVGLRGARELMPDGKKISVALAEFIPESIVWLTKKTKDFKNYNSEVNYRNVAQYSDQIVVMVYDTGLQKEWLYRNLVSEQTIWLSRLLPDVELFVGIPSYDDNVTGEPQEVENIENGVLGVIDGLNNVRSDEEVFAGLAIYAYWETDEEEWDIYQNNWIK